MIFGSPLKLYIQTDKDSYYLGEPVNYNVILELKKPRDIKYLRVLLEVVLHGKTTCTYRETSGEDENDTYTMETEFTIPLKTIEQKLLENARLGAGRHVIPGTLILPPDLPASSTHGVFSIVWTLTAIAPGRLGSKRVSKQLIVYPWDKPGPETIVEKDSKNIHVTARIPAYVPRGTRFPVNISIYAKNSPVKCNSIEAKIVNNVYISASTTSTRARVSVEECYNVSYKREYSNIKIAENVVIAPNQAISLPLTLSIPYEGVPSFNRGFDYSEWTLVITCKKGIMSRENIEFKLNVS